MSLNVVTLAVAKKYTDNSISGITGTLAGKNCTIKSITEITGGNRVTFEWTADDSTTHTATMDVMNGKGIASISVNSSNHLIITYSDGTTADAGEIEITAAVDSVNGETGDVILTASDVDAYSKSEVDTALGNKADKATTLSGYGITDAYTKTETDTLLSAKADSSTTLSGYGITDAYTKTEADSAITTAIGALDVTDSATAGSYVTTVSETDGKISVTKEAADASPTASSTKMVTSGGVYTDTQNVYAANGVLGAKNLLPLTLANLKAASTNGTWSNNVYTLNGITYTVNLDDNDNVESILVNGTATGTSAITVGEIELKNGTYYINGTPSGASVAGYSTLIQVYNGSSWTDVYCNSQNSFTVTNRKIKAYVARIASGTTVSSVYYYPMIRLATDSDTTYTPYAKTNQELTQQSSTNTDAIADIVNVYGTKNLFPNTATTQTIQDITMTVNDDKSVTCTGTNSQSWDATLLLGTVTLKAGSYIISGCPSGGSSSTYWMNVQKNGSWYADNTGNDISLELSETAEISLTLSLESNITVSNIIFRPMIRLASIEDDTYVPYAETNYQLTQNKVSYEANGILGAKNLLKNTASTQEVNGVTFTVNSGGSVTVNGTSTGTAYINVGSFTFENGKSYILSGCPLGGSASGYSLYAYSNSLLGRDIGDGVTIIGNGDTADIRISVPNGVTVSSLTFYPMIRLATDTDDTYQPYAMTNQQLTSSLTDLLNNGSTNSITEQTAFSDLTNGMTYHISSATSTTIWSGYAKLIHVIKYSSTRGVQIAYKMTSASDVSSAMAYRLCYDGTYSNWSIISATNQS